MAISADSIYSETLQSIIDAKLEELVRKREAFESSKLAVQKAFASETDEAEQVRILKDGVKTCFKLRSTSVATGIDGTGANSDLVQLLQNLDRFLEQPRFDPSVSSAQLKTWASKLGHHFDVQSNRYQFASVYAKLVTEWLSSEKRLSHAKKDDGDVQMTESFEELDSAAKLESRLAWERTVFQAAEVDTNAVKELLNKIFDGGSNNKPLAKALGVLRNKVTAFEGSLSASGQFNETTLRWTIKGLLSGDVLSQEKRTVLKDFLNNTIILSEIADVLNLRMANMEDWTWGTVVPVEQAKRIAGRYSVFMQEDLLQAIFIQYIGTKWSVFFKLALRDVVRMRGAWINSRQPITKLDQLRRDYYLGSDHGNNQLNLHSSRTKLWFERYFMAQLLSFDTQEIISDDGAEEADLDEEKEEVEQKPMSQAPRRQLASKAARKTGLGAGGAKRHRKIVRDRDVDEDPDFPVEGDIDDENGGEPLNLMKLKQNLLHILRTEVLFNTRFHGEITAFRAQFDSWNSMLPHETILAVAGYLGISETWLKFFRTFMRAPLGFAADEATGDPRTRLRGVPASHPLSEVLGELVLFCLDLNINHTTGGQNVWRVQDDLWFWSADHSAATRVWSTVTTFCEIMGVKLDMKKAGSVHVTQEKKRATKSKLQASLPPNRIRWGFLYLDSQSGQWEIDQALVDVHIKELRRQLSAKDDCVFSWVQAWNAYANTFFNSNFGKPARCFGRSHAEKVLTTLGRVQRKLFEGHGHNNVVEHVKGMLEQRFQISDIPEGYPFFPTELGGLELRNPFIGLLLVYDNLDKQGDPENLLDKFERDEREAYEEDKKFFERGNVSRYNTKEPDWEPEGEDKDKFMSFEEWAKYREMVHCNFDGELLDVWKELLEPCTERTVVATSDIMTAMNLMDKSGVIGKSTSINGDWHSMSGYWKWVTQMYGGELVQRFGGLNIVDNGVLPIGMVSLFRRDRVQWKG